MGRIKRVPGAGVKKAAAKTATRVYLFIDDSNLFIEGQRTAANGARGWRIDCDAAAS